MHLITCSCYGLIIDHLYVQQINTNGPISFQNAFSRWSPVPFPENLPVLFAPFWDDLFNGISGSNISYRLTNDPAYLQRARRDVLGAQFTGIEDFTPTYLLIATWYKIPHLGRSAQAEVNFRKP